MCVCVGLNVCCTEFSLTSLGVFFIKQTNWCISVSPHCSVSVDLTLIFGLFFCALTTEPVGKFVIFLYWINEAYFYFLKYPKSHEYQEGLYLDKLVL